MTENSSSWMMSSSSRKNYLWKRCFLTNFVLIVGATISIYFPYLIIIDLDTIMFIFSNL